MKLTHSFTAPAPAEEVWEALLDPERVAPCLPGASLTSVDGKTFGPLSTLRVATADGKSRAAAPADVRVVRWRLAQPVAPGGEGQVAFRALLK